MNQLSKTNKWIYKNESFEEPPVDIQSFVYIITNLINGKSYIGRKNFYTIKKMGNKRKKIVSDWKEYWSSCKDLKDDIEKYGKEFFCREILMLCKNKGTSNYIEAKMQFQYEVLEKPDEFYNKIINCRVFHKHIKL